MSVIGRPTPQPSPPPPPPSSQHSGSCTSESSVSTVQHRLCPQSPQTEDQQWNRPCPQLWPGTSYCHEGMEQRPQYPLLSLEDNDPGRVWKKGEERGGRRERGGREEGGGRRRTGKGEKEEGRERPHSYASCAEHIVEGIVGGECEALHLPQGQWAGPALSTCTAHVPQGQGQSILQSSCPLMSPAKQGHPPPPAEATPLPPCPLLTRRLERSLLWREDRTGPEHSWKGAWSEEEWRWWEEG